MTTFANLEITSLWRHWWRHNSETIRDREKRRPPCAMKSCEQSNCENRIALRQLLQNWKLRHLWRHNLHSRWKLQKMAWENFSIGTFYNITKNQDNPIKTVGWARHRHITYVLVWLKSDQRRLRKTLHKQTNRQTDRHYENNGHLVVNQKINVKVFTNLLKGFTKCCSSLFPGPKQAPVTDDRPNLSSASNHKT